MFILSRENISEYLKEWMPQLDQSKPLSIYVVGEGALEDDGDGFINYVYRVSDGKMNVVVKQGLTHGKLVPFPLPAERNKLEYESFELRKAIVPDYIPDVYFFDEKNYIFAMEDVSYLKIARFQLNKSVQFRKLPFQIAEYCAKTGFYCSEYYLGIVEFRKLISHFMNQGMRTIFDTNAFIVADDTNGNFGGGTDPLYDDFSMKLVKDPAIIRERYLLRESYMKDCETFVHGDLHTSNIFADHDRMKVIDMEYTFCGPMAYDLGYAMNCFLSQYICADFRTFDSVAEKEEFQSYCLASMKILNDEFFRIFTECWKADAKPEYRQIDGFREAKYDKWFRDIIGFCANANFSRAIGDIGFPEYDQIETKEDMRHAVCISAIIDRALFINRHKYTCFDDCLRDIQTIQKAYMAGIGR